MEHVAAELFVVGAQEQADPFAGGEDTDDDGNVVALDVLEQHRRADPRRALDGPSRTDFAVHPGQFGLGVDLDGGRDELSGMLFQKFDAFAQIADGGFRRGDSAEFTASVRHRCSAACRMSWASLMAVPAACVGRNALSIMKSWMMPPKRICVTATPASRSLAA